MSHESPGVTSCAVGGVTEKVGTTSFPVKDGGWGRPGQASAWCPLWGHPSLDPRGTR